MTNLTLDQAATIIEVPFDKGREDGLAPLTVTGLAIDPDTDDIIGAVGISGDRGENDEACAVAGLEVAGLKAEPGGG